MKGLSLTLSVIFHPLLMATYGCLLIFFGIRHTVYDYMTPFDTKWRISVIVFLFSFMFPVLNIIILYKLKRIPSLTLSGQEDRTFPYIMTALFYFGLFYLLKDINIWNSIKLFVLGGGLGILLTAIINLKYKISAHMVGLGGLLGVLLSLSYLIKFDMTFFYVSVILIAGLVGMARLFLQEHKPSQLYSGFLLGLLVQTVLFYTFQKITFA
ncbi:MAG: putative rane protein [Bacteroidetes bacterium]|nr:putative rane protein [Bacteroidota bacterium]